MGKASREVGPSTEVCVKHPRFDDFCIYSLYYGKITNTACSFNYFTSNEWDSMVELTWFCDL